MPVEAVHGPRIVLAAVHTRMLHHSSHLSAAAAWARRAVAPLRRGQLVYAEADTLR